MNYKITVFTPTYNRAHTLHRVYNSIKKQTLQKRDNVNIFEWIIVDDGSSDNTRELVKRWQNESEFEIIYFYQENQGKPSATRKGIELSRGELFLICDSDDEFLPDTFEVFIKIWDSFSKEEKEKCSGIAVLCQDQFGNRIGKDYPIEKEFVPIEKSVFGWRDKGLGETWAAIKTQNLKKYFKIPEEAKNLKFIPESFFWSRIAIESKQYSYPLNKVQRIYYVNEGDNISQNVRQKYPEGFLFESKWFVKKYPFIFFKYPKVYIKHLLKVIYYGLKLYKWIKI
jgi:glycosyltransferase involved in cell wall biosynthesis